MAAITGVIGQVGVAVPVPRGSHALCVACWLRVIGARRRTNHRAQGGFANGASRPSSLSRARRGSRRRAKQPGQTVLMCALGTLSLGQRAGWDVNMRIAWCFPGQGSQVVGMGKELYDAFASARDVFARADAALGDSISELSFQGPESELVLTRNTQPALVTTSLAALAALRERVPNSPPPASAAGHSLGEYSALVAAGALRLEDAVSVVRLRGEAMQRAVPQGTGAMAAIMGVPPEQLELICQEASEGEVVSPANFNAPGQIVIAGHAAAVSRASKLVSERQGKAIPLKVSAPFHCALMAPAREALAARLGSVEISPLSFPVIANVDARPNLDPSRVKGLLVQQVDHPVRWDETIRAMASDGVTHILELGPGKVLAGLVKRIAKEIEVLSVGTVASIEAASKLFS